MHEVKDTSERDNSIVEITGTSDEETSRRLQDRSTDLKQPGLKRALLIGGTILLVFAVVLAGLLVVQAQQKKPVSSAHRTAPTAPTPITKLLPTPSATALSTLATTGYDTFVTVADGVAYVGTAQNTFYALRAANGARLWSVTLDGTAGGQPIVTGGVVYAAVYSNTDTGPAFIYALRASDGKLLWRYNTGLNYFDQSVVENGTVYTTSPNGIVALRASDGSQMWQASMKGTASISSVVNGIVYASSFVDQNGPGTIYALQASDGKHIWSYSSSQPLAAPVVINGIAYANSWSGILYAFRQDNGKLLWQRALSGNPLAASMQVEDGILYLLTQKIIYPTGRAIQFPATNLLTLLWRNLQTRKTIPQKEIHSTVCAIQVSDGNVSWCHPLNNGGDSFSSWLTVNHGVVYGNERTNIESNSGAGYVFALRAKDGSVLWQDEMLPNPTDTGEQIGGILYVGSGDNSSSMVIYALRANDGSLLWSYPVNALSASSTTIVGGTLYIGAMNGVVYALSTGNGKLLWHYQTNLGW